LTYDPVLNGNGDPYDSFGFKVYDGTAYSTAAYTMTIDVTAQNDLPTSADNTVTTLEDTQYVFLTSDFPFTDVDGTFQGIKVTTLETVGALKLNGADVTLNQEITAADILANKLTYDPVLNGNGDPYDSFGFKVYDGTAYSTAAYTMTIDVTAQNDPPTANPQSVITNEDAARVITLTGSDIDGSIAKYTIASLPSNGDLWDGVTQITTTPTDLSANTVKYQPDTGYSGSDSFTFTVTDDGTPLPAQTSSPATISITILQYHSITVKQHWNLISLPVYDTISKANIIVRYGGHDHTWAEAVSESVVLVTLYDWQRGVTQAYAPTDTLAPGNGYWMWAYFDCELLIASNAVGTGHITDLQTKWNIMGLPYSTPLVATNLIITYDGHDHTWTEAINQNIILGFIYGWDSSTQMYTLKTTFVPGEGYWMYAYYDCLLKK